MDIRASCHNRARENFITMCIHPPIPLAKPTYLVGALAHALGGVGVLALPTIWSLGCEQWLVRPRRQRSHAKGASAGMARIGCTLGHPFACKKDHLDSLR